MQDAVKVAWLASQAEEPYLRMRARLVLLDQLVVWARGESPTFQDFMLQLLQRDEALHTWLSMRVIDQLCRRGLILDSR